LRIKTCNVEGSLPLNVEIVHKWSCYSCQKFIVVSWNHSDMVVIDQDILDRDWGNFSIQLPFRVNSSIDNKLNIKIKFNGNLLWNSGIFAFNYKWCSGLFLCTDFNTSVLTNFQKVTIIHAQRNKKFSLKGVTVVVLDFRKERQNLLCGISVIKL